MRDYQLGKRIWIAFIILCVAAIAVLIHAGLSDGATTVDRKVYCWRSKQVKKVESAVFKTDLAVAKMKIKWCDRNFQRIVSKHVSVTHRVTGAGSTAQWHDEGVEFRDNNMGQGNRTFIARATVHFSQTIGPVHTDDEYIHLKIRVYPGGGSTAPHYKDARIYQKG